MAVHVSTSSDVGNHRVMVLLAVEGDLRFISHRDTARMLERACTRAGLPLAYTGGYNPHIKLSLPLPRPVGMSSEADVVLVELSESWDSDRISAALAPRLPQGARLVGVRRLPAGTRPQLTSVTYELAVPAEMQAEVQQGVSRVMSAEQWVVSRCDRQGRAKPDLDIRPFIRKVTFEAGILRFVTEYRDGRAAAPADLLKALGLDWQRLRHLVRRKQVEWCL